MNLKRLAVILIKFYQTISQVFGQKCRYYPSCSNYAIWLFENDSFFKALIKVIFRILRCNQFFKGGIDYPVVKKDLKINYLKKQKKIKYWLIPKNDKFIIIKANNE